MPGTFSFYFYVILLIAGWNAQFAAGCVYDLRAAVMVCPVTAPARTGNK